MAASQYDDDTRTDDEIAQVAIDKHKETTAQAYIALRAAEQCRQVGDDTLVALDAQGKQMTRMQRDYDEVDDYADNAESNLSWLGRCCWCCNCFRPAAKPKKGWGKGHFKHKERKKNKGKNEQQPHPRAVARNAQAAEQAQTTQARQNGKGKQKQSAKQAAATVPRKKHTIGDGLEGDVGEEIRKETYHQDDILDQVEKSLEQVKSNAVAIHATLDQQDKQVDQVTRQSEHVHNRVQSMRRQKVLRNT